MTGLPRAPLAGLPPLHSEECHSKPLLAKGEVKTERKEEKKPLPIERKGGSGRRRSRGSSMPIAMTTPQTSATTLKDHPPPSSHDSHLWISTLPHSSDASSSSFALPGNSQVQKKSEKKTPPAVDTSGGQGEGRSPSRTPPSPRSRIVSVPSQEGPFESSPTMAQGGHGTSPSSPVTSSPPVALTASITRSPSRSTSLALGTRQQPREEVPKMKKKKNEHEKRRRKAKNSEAHSRRKEEPSREDARGRVHGATNDRIDSEEEEEEEPIPQAWRWLPQEELRFDPLSLPTMTAQQQAWETEERQSILLTVVVPHVLRAIQYTVDPVVTRHSASIILRVLALGMSSPPSLSSSFSSSSTFRTRAKERQRSWLGPLLPHLFHTALHLLHAPVESGGHRCAVGLTRGSLSLPFLSNRSLTRFSSPILAISEPVFPLQEFQYFARYRTALEEKRGLSTELSTVPFTLTGEWRMAAADWMLLVLRSDDEVDPGHRHRHRSASHAVGITETSLANGATRAVRPRISGPLATVSTKEEVAVEGCCELPSLPSAMSQSITLTCGATAASWPSGWWEGLRRWEQELPMRVEHAIQEVWEWHGEVLWLANAITRSVTSSTPLFLGTLPYGMTTTTTSSPHRMSSTPWKKKTHHVPPVPSSWTSVRTSLLSGGGGAFSSLSSKSTEAATATAAEVRPTSYGGPSSLSSPVPQERRRIATLNYAALPVTPEELLSHAKELVYNVPSPGCRFHKTPLSLLSEFLQVMKWVTVAWKAHQGGRHTLVSTTWLPPEVLRLLPPAVPPSIVKPTQDPSHVTENKLPAAHPKEKEAKEEGIQRGQPSSCASSLRLLQGGASAAVVSASPTTTRLTPTRKTSEEHPTPQSTPPTHPRKEVLPPPPPRKMSMPPPAPPAKDTRIISIKVPWVSSVTTFAFPGASSSSSSAPGSHASLLEKNGGFFAASPLDKRPHFSFSSCFSSMLKQLVQLGRRLLPRVSMPLFLCFHPIQKQARAFIDGPSSSTSALLGYSSTPFTPSSPSSSSLSSTAWRIEAAVLQEVHRQATTWGVVPPAGLRVALALCALLEVSSFFSITASSTKEEAAAATSPPSKEALLADDNAYAAYARALFFWKGPMRTPPPSPPPPRRRRGDALSSPFLKERTEEPEKDAAEAKLVEVLEGMAEVAAALCTLPRWISFPLLVRHHPSLLEVMATALRCRRGRGDREEREWLEDWEMERGLSTTLQGAPMTEEPEWVREAGEVVSWRRRREEMELHGTDETMSRQALLHHLSGVAAPLARRTPFSSTKSHVQEEEKEKEETQRGSQDLLHHEEEEEYWFRLPLEDCLVRAMEAVRWHLTLLPSPSTPTTTFDVSGTIAVEHLPYWFHGRHRATREGPRRGREEERTNVEEGRGGGGGGGASATPSRMGTGGGEEALCDALSSSSSFMNSLATMPTSEVVATPLLVHLVSIQDRLAEWSTRHGLVGHLMPSGEEGIFFSSSSPLTASERTPRKENERKGTSLPSIPAGSSSSFGSAEEDYHGRLVLFPIWSAPATSTSDFSPFVSPGEEAAEEEREEGSHGTTQKERHDASSFPLAGPSSSSSPHGKEQTSHAAPPSCDPDPLSLATPSPLLPSSFPFSVSSSSLLPRSPSFPPFLGNGGATSTGGGSTTSSCANASPLPPPPLSSSSFSFERGRITVHGYHLPFYIADQLCLPSFSLRVLPNLTLWRLALEISETITAVRREKGVASSSSPWRGEGEKVHPQQLLFLISNRPVVAPFATFAEVLCAGLAASSLPTRTKGNRLENVAEHQPKKTKTMTPSKDIEGRGRGRRGAGGGVETMEQVEEEEGVMVILPPKHTIPSGAHRVEVVVLASPIPYDLFYGGSHEEAVLWPPPLRSLVPHWRTTSRTPMAHRIREEARGEERCDDTPSIAPSRPSSRPFSFHESKERGEATRSSPAAVPATVVQVAECATASTRGEPVPVGAPGVAEEEEKGVGGPLRFTVTKKGRERSSVREAGGRLHGSTLAYYYQHATNMQRLQWWRRRETEAEEEKEGDDPQDTTTSHEDEMGRLFSPPSSLASSLVRWEETGLPALIALTETLFSVLRHGPFSLNSVLFSSSPETLLSPSSSRSTTTTEKDALGKGEAPKARRGKRRGEEEDPQETIKGMERHYGSAVGSVDDDASLVSTTTTTTTPRNWLFSSQYPMWGGKGAGILGVLIPERMRQPEEGGEKWIGQGEKEEEEEASRDAVVCAVERGSVYHRLCLLTAYRIYQEMDLYRFPALTLPIFQSLKRKLGKKQHHGRGSDSFRPHEEEHPSKRMKPDEEEEKETEPIPVVEKMDLPVDMLVLWSCPSIFPLAFRKAIFYSLLDAYRLSRLPQIPPAGNDTNGIPSGGGPGGAAGEGGSSCGSFVSTPAPINAPNTTTNTSATLPSPSLFLSPNRNTNTGALNGGTRTGGGGSNMLAGLGGGLSGTNARMLHLILVDRIGPAPPDPLCRKPASSVRAGLSTSTTTTPLVRSIRSTEDVAPPPQQREEEEDAEEGGAMTTTTATAKAVVLVSPGTEPLTPSTAGETMETSSTESLPLPMIPKSPVTSTTALNSAENPRSSLATTTTTTAAAAGPISTTGASAAASSGMTAVVSTLSGSSSAYPVTKRGSSKGGMSSLLPSLFNATGESTPRRRTRPSFCSSYTGDPPLPISLLPTPSPLPPLPMVKSCSSSSSTTSTQPPHSFFSPLPSLPTMTPPSPPPPPPPLPLPPVLWRGTEWRQLPPIGLEWTGYSNYRSYAARVTIEVPRDPMYLLDAGSTLLHRYAFCALPMDIAYAGEVGLGVGPLLEFLENFGLALAQEVSLGLWRTEEVAVYTASPSTTASTTTTTTMPTWKPSEREKEHTVGGLSPEQSIMETEDRNAFTRFPAVPPAWERGGPPSPRPPPPPTAATTTGGGEAPVEEEGWGVASSPRYERRVLPLLFPSPHLLSSEDRFACTSSSSFFFASCRDEIAAAGAEKRGRRRKTSPLLSASTGDSIESSASSPLSHKEDGRAVPSERSREGPLPSLLRSLGSESEKRLPPKEAEDTCTTKEAEGPSTANEPAKSGGEKKDRLWWCYILGLYMGRLLTLRRPAPFRFHPLFLKAFLAEERAAAARAGLFSPSCYWSAPLSPVPHPSSSSRFTRCTIQNDMPARGDPISTETATCRPRYCCTRRAEISKEESEREGGVPPSSFPEWNTRTPCWQPEWSPARGSGLLARSPDEASTHLNFLDPVLEHSLRQLERLSKEELQSMELFFVWTTEEEVMEEVVEEEDDQRPPRAASIVHVAQQEDGQKKVPSPSTTSKEVHTAAPTVVVPTSSAPLPSSLSPQNVPLVSMTPPPPNFKTSTERRRRNVPVIRPKEEPLVPGGETIPVTRKNVHYYTFLLRQRHLDHTLGVMLFHFRQGLHAMVHPSFLRLFTVPELDELWSGSAEERIWKDSAALASCVVVSHGYTWNSEMIVFFLDIVGHWPGAYQRLFLKYLTGSTMLPVASAHRTGATGSGGGRGRGGGGGRDRTSTSSPRGPHRGEGEEGQGLLDGLSPSSPCLLDPPIMIVRRDVDAGSLVNAPMPTTSFVAKRPSKRRRRRTQRQRRIDDATHEDEEERAPPFSLDATSSFINGIPDTTTSSGPSTARTTSSSEDTEEEEEEDHEEATVKDWEHTMWQQHVDATLPSVSTCFHYLKLPKYSSRAVLERQLLRAITDGQGSFDLT